MKRNLSEKDFKLFERMVQMKEETLLKNLDHFIRKYYKKVYTTDSYIYAIGDAPVVLLAHLDTVFANPPTDIYYDTKKSVIWAPSGLGADDRAGVLAIMKIVLDGLRPSIIFTTGEEIGGVGARAFVRNFPSPTPSLKYLIQLDRRGSVDAVFYNCANDIFTQYVESFGFVENFGTFTDISTICPRWKIAGVNLSIGYENEHTLGEVFHTNYFLATYEKVKTMISESFNLEKPFEYIYDNAFSYGNSWFPSSEWVMCESCKDGFLEHEIFPVKKPNGGIVLLCPDCLVEKAEWCSVCGDPFLVESKGQTVCADCQNGKTKVKL